MTDRRTAACCSPIHTHPAQAAYPVGRTPWWPSWAKADGHRRQNDANGMDCHSAPGTAVPWQVCKREALLSQPRYRRQCRPRQHRQGGSHPVCYSQLRQSLSRTVWQWLPPLPSHRRNCSPPAKMLPHLRPKLQLLAWQPECGMPGSIAHHP